MGFRQDECRPGASAWACCLWFVALLHVVVRCRAVHRCCVLGCGFPLKISLWLSCLHCVGFQQFGGSGRGFLSRGLLAASGSCKTSCSFVFCRCFRTGSVSPRLEVEGHLFAFALALQVAVAFSPVTVVREAGSQGSQPCVCLVLAFSTWTLKI